MHSVGLWVRENRFEPDLIPPNIREGFWNYDGLCFLGCETLVNRAKLFWNYGTCFRLAGERWLFTLVLGDLVLGLKLLHKGLIFTLHVNARLLLLHMKARHQSRGYP